MKSANLWMNLALCVLLAGGVSAAQSVIDLTDGAAVQLDAAGNAKGTTYWFHGDGSLTLPSVDVQGGLYEFLPILLATNGVITVDASGLTNCRGLRWSNHLRVDRQLVVKGVDYIEYGSSSAGAYGSTDITYFRADPAFVDAEGAPIAEPAGLTFTNAVTLCTKPTCAWRIAPKCWFWPYVDDALGSPGQTLEVADYNLGIISVNSISADVVKVGANGGLSCRPCFLLWDSSEKGKFWKWGGRTDTWRKDVVLDGGVFYTSSTPVFTLDGSLTGQGRVELRGGNGVTITGDVRVDGDFKVYNKGLVLGAEDVQATVTVSSANKAPISFTQPAVRLTGLAGNSLENCVLTISNNQSLVVGNLSGALSILGGPENCAVTVQNLAADTQLRVADGIALTVAQGSVDKAIELVDANGTSQWSFSGPTTGERMTVPLAVDAGVAAPTLTLGGKLNITGVPANLAALTIAANGDVTGDFPPTVPIHAQGGKWIGAGGWQKKVALWCDASQEDTFTYVGELNPGLQLAVDSPNKIFWWHDCRPDRQDYALAMSRFSTNDWNSSQGKFNVDVYPWMYPSVIADGLNGKSILKCSYGNQTRLGVLTPDKPLQTSRTRSKGTYDGIASQYAIVLARCVHASNGAALLSSDDASLQATGKGYNASIFSNDTLTVYKNGTRVADPTTTPWGNAQWAIYSFTTEGAVVNGLTVAKEPGDNTGGGFDYAEILVFSEMPTEEERKLAEEYLAAKWGLEVSHANTTIAQSVMGCGETVLQVPTRISGMFAGTIDLNGQRLEIPDGKAPIRESEIPDEGRVLWLDPSAAATVVMGSDPAKPAEIEGLYQRDNAAARVENGAGWYCQSAYSENGVTNRRPHLVTASKGGLATTWLDFADAYGCDKDGNNLMFRQLPYREPMANYADISTRVSDGGWGTVSARTFFLVLDTRRGGGTPFCSQAGGGVGSTHTYDVGSRGDNPSWSDPIWGPKTQAQATGGSLRLDGVVVADGTTQGFNGRPEVMFFQPAPGAVQDTVSIKALGMLNVNNSAAQQEIMGEVLLYTNVLDEAISDDIEAYLMKKWLGKARDGYQDFRDATVTGAGTLVVPSFKALPQLGAGFTGDIAVTNEVQTFTFAAGATVATEAVDIATTALALPDEVTVNLVFAQVPDPGVYTLFAANLQGAPAFSLGTVQGFSRPDRLALKWNASAKQLQALIRTQGTSILLR